MKSEDQTDVIYLDISKHLNASLIINCLSNYTNWDSKINYCHGYKITLPTEIKMYTMGALCQL